jgi:CDP-diacylglycerol--glycerol-3-phosphate 3-phosphatidyltransferase
VTAEPQARSVSHWNAANAFTSLRVVLVPVFAWLLVVRRPAAPVLAAVVFAVAAATDGVDGWVARRFQLVSGFGVFLDQFADKLLIGTALVALAADDRLPWWAAGVILGREFAIVILRVAFARSGRAMPPTRAGKVKTAAQILAVMLLTVQPPHDHIAAAFLYLAVVLTIASGVDYFASAVRGRAAVTWR